MKRATNRARSPRDPARDDSQTAAVTVLHPDRGEPSTVATLDGVAATVHEQGQCLTVRDTSGGEVLFTYDVRTGQATAHGRGSLRIEAPHGGLELDARDAIHIRAGREVSIESDDELSLKTPDGNALSMGRRGMEVRSSALRAVLEEGRLSVRDATFVAERFESAAEKARHVYGVAEVRAHRIVERVRDVFREAEGLSQTRAGRVRTVARGAFQVLADRATIKAEDDLSLMGDKIHLA